MKCFNLVWDKNKFIMDVKLFQRPELRPFRGVSSLLWMISLIIIISVFWHLLPSHWVLVSPPLSSRCPHAEYHHIFYPILTWAASHFSESLYFLILAFNIPNSVTREATLTGELEVTVPLSAHRTSFIFKLIYIVNIFTSIHTLFHPAAKSFLLDWVN